MAFKDHAHVLLEERGGRKSADGWNRNGLHSGCLSQEIKRENPCCRKSRL